MFVYPTLLISLILLNLPWTFNALPFWGYFIPALLLFLFNLLRKVFEIHSPILQNLTRMFLGLSMALAITTVITAPGIFLKVVLGISVFSLVVTYNLINGFKTLRICKTCKEYGDFPDCSGKSKIK